MRYDRGAPERPVNTTLNEDLVRRVRGLTSNLSRTVETLLAAWIAEAEAKDAERQRQIEEHISADAAFVAKCASLVDEFDIL